MGGRYDEGSLPPLPGGLVPVLHQEGPQLTMGSRNESTPLSTCLCHGLRMLCIAAASRATACSIGLHAGGTLKFMLEGMLGSSRGTMVSLSAKSTCSSVVFRSRAPWHAASRAAWGRGACMLWVGVLQE